MIAPTDDAAIRMAALTNVLQMLADCQDILDGYGLSLEAAHLELPIALLRKHVPGSEPPLDKLMEKFGF